MNLAKCQKDEFFHFNAHLSKPRSLQLLQPESPNDGSKTREDLTGLCPYRLFSDCLQAAYWGLVFTLQASAQSRLNVKEMDLAEASLTCRCMQRSIRAIYGLSGPFSHGNPLTIEWTIFQSRTVFGKRMQTLYGIWKGLLFLFGRGEK